VALKKYCCGTSPVSKISDNEDATAALGYSKVLSVQSSVGEPIPEFRHRPKEGTKIPSSTTTEDAWDVFPQKPLWLKLVKNSTIDEGKVPPWIFKPFSETCD
jgi:hypothetical protein